MANTYAEITEHLLNLRVPFTSEDARAMAISAHIEASKKGYRGLHPPPIGDKNVAQEPQQPPQPPQQAQSQGDYDYHGMKHVASIPSNNKLRAVIVKAIDTLTAKGTSAREAETTIKKTVRDAFEKEWEFTPELSSFKNMNQGQVSWTINYIKTEWGVE